MKNLVLITAPASFPITLAEVKAWLPIDGNENDTLLTDLIKSVTEDAELHTDRRFVSQVWDLQIGRVPKYCFLPYAPAISVQSVKYYDSNNVLQTIDPQFYTLVLSTNKPSILEFNKDFASYTRLDSVTIRFTCGYTTMPPALKRTLLTMCRLYFDNRSGDFSSLQSEQINSLLNQHKVGLYV